MVEWAALLIALLALYRTYALDKALVKHLLIIYRRLARGK